MERISVFRAGEMYNVVNDPRTSFIVPDVERVRFFKLCARVVLRTRTSSRTPPVGVV